MKYEYSSNAAFLPHVLSFYSQERINKIAGDFIYALLLANSVYALLF